jgi:cytochrome c oxidase subunit 4
MNTAEQPKSQLKRYLIIYFLLLALASVQFILAYQHVEGVQLLVRMLAVALIQAGLAVMYFMHLADERRSLFLTLIPATIFVLLLMNMIWSDSFRLLHFRLLAK